jgi:hypothetical protein
MMQFRYIIWQKTRDGQIEPIMTVSPAGMTSSERAREDARTLVLEHGIAAHSLEVTSEDGSISEEWRWHRKQWTISAP